MLQTFAILLVFQTVGEVISYALHLPVPGPVIGMLLLFGWLVFDNRLLPVVQNSANELLKHLSLLFVPAGVGVVQKLDLIAAHGLAIAVVLLLSVVITLLVTVAAFVATSRLLAPKRDRS